MGGPALETLARFRIPICLLWWFGFLGGPVWVVVAVVLIRRGRHSRDLRWVVDMPKEAA